MNVGSTGADWFLGLWSTDALSEGVAYYLSVYAAVTCATAFITLLNTAAFALGGISAAEVAHRRMFERVLRCPVAFFDTTPLGRVLNRFSTDVATVDKDLPASFASYAQTASRIASTIVVQAAIMPYTLIGAAPIGVNTTLYDVLGRTFRGGVRFKM